MKTVLITGATGGIGLALAHRYAARGDRLVLVGRREPHALDPAFFTADRYCHTDLAAPTCADEIAHWLDSRGIHTIDTLIHNAALGYAGPIYAQSPSSINALVDVNLRAPVTLTHCLLPRMAAGGQLVFVSSVAAALPAPDYATYSATKAALDAFARNLRLELQARDRAVSVHVMHPGATRTDMHAKAGLPPERMRGNFAAPDDVAAAIERAVDRGRKTQTIGAANGFMHVGVRAGGTLVDRMMMLSARRTPATETGIGDHAGAAPHALVTGAADGIGAALVRALAARGYAITGVDVDARRSHALAAQLHEQGCDARFITTDLAQPDSAATIVRQTATRPPVTLLIHNAGINAVGPFDTVEIAQQMAVLDVNLRAPLLLTNALLADGIIPRGGSVVCVASLSRFVGYPGAAVYAATKDGLASYARSLGVALAPADVNVLTVFPGPTRTAHARRYSPDNRREASRMPPEELARRIVDAVEKRRRQLIPGAANRVFATTGRVAPWLTDRAMQRSIFQKLVAGAPGSVEE